MIKITVNQDLPQKKLTNYLVSQGVQVVGIETERDQTDNFVALHITIPEAQEAALTAALATFNPNEIYDLELKDLAELLPQIAGELAWITTAIADIDTGLALVDAATLAQLRVIVKGLMQNQRRVLLEQRAELRAWRYVIRRLAS